MQLIALFGFVPLHSATLISSREFFYSSSIQFFIALIVSMNLFLSRPYQIIVTSILVTGYYQVSVNAEYILYTENEMPQKVDLE